MHVWHRRWRCALYLASFLPTIASLLIKHPPQLEDSFGMSACSCLWICLLKLQPVQIWLWTSLCCLDLRTGTPGVLPPKRHNLALYVMRAYTRDVESKTMMRSWRWRARPKTKAIEKTIEEIWSIGQVASIAIGQTHSRKPNAPWLIRGETLPPRKPSDLDGSGRGWPWGFRGLRILGKCVGCNVFAGSQEGLVRTGLCGRCVPE
jgi:hypothetical protein